MSPDGDCTLRGPAGATAVSDARHVVMGAVCEVSAIDSGYGAIAGCQSEVPAEIRLPVPAAFKPRIDNVRVASIVDGVVGTIQGSAVRFARSSGDLEDCGLPSQLPATVAAAVPAGSLQPESLLNPALRRSRPTSGATRIGRLALSCGRCFSPLRPRPPFQ